MNETESLEFDHEYSLHLSIGLSGCDRVGSINPANESSYTKAEWDALSLVEQEHWIEEACDDWANELIEKGWEV